jgi:hypothetical protein
MCDCKVNTDQLKDSFKNLLRAHKELEGGYYIFLFCDICKKSQEEPPRVRVCPKCWKDICWECDNIENRTHFVYSCEQELQLEMDYDESLASIQSFFN